MRSNESMRRFASFTSKLFSRDNRGDGQPMDLDDFDPPSVTLTVRKNMQPETNQSLATSPQPVSFLYSLTKRWAWQAVAFRCGTHPHEAKAMEQDSNGDTILHWACFGSPPPFVVDAIVEICPKLLTIRNDMGNLPLHTACQYRASSRVIRCLVEGHPESAGMSIGGSTEKSRSSPLHILCDYGCHVDSIRAIVEVAAGATSSRTKDRIFRRTPLQILNQRKNLNEFHAQLAELRRLRLRNREAAGHYHNEVDQPDKRRTMETKLLFEGIRTMGFWQKAQLLVLAEFCNQPVTTAEPSETTLIHALIGLKHHCPPSLLEFAVLMKPQVLLQRDKDTQDTPLHSAVKVADESIISDILLAEPEAAKLVDRDGRFPLQLYVERDNEMGWNLVIENLILEYPLAIESLDMDRRLYPLIWSRLTSRKNVNALYSTVRGNPSLFG